MTDRQNDLVFTSLIYDLSRFYQKSVDKFLGKYENLFSRYFDIQHISLILKDDDSCKDEIKIIKEARELSLMESDRSTGEVEGLSLVSVFSRVQIKNNTERQKVKYALKPLSPSNCFPREGGETEQTELQELIGHFESDMDDLANAGEQSVTGFFTVFESILEKYTWCIASTDYEGEDISLFQHMKNMAAISGCLCEAENGDAFCFVMGDFAGIQNYIFSVSNVGERGVAQRLRARSFLVDETISVMTYDILSELDLPVHHILLLTGGKFYLLLPNTGRTRDLLQEKKKEYERDLFNRYKGQISVNLTWISGGRILLEDYSETVTELADRQSEEKYQVFQSVLQNGNTWEENAFTLYPDLSGKKICTSCNSALTDAEERYCENCKRQEEIGDLLPEAKYIVYLPKGDPQIPLIGGKGINIIDGRMDSDDFFLCSKISGEIGGRDMAYPIQKGYMANHVPTKNERVCSFNEIAGKSKGDRKLGLFKADVDILGFIFSKGLYDYEKKRHFGTISRIATLSKLFIVFFSGYVEEIIENKYKDIYCVFSGGDDLFLIGPWNMINDFALFIRKKFVWFTGNNPDITISAGIGYFDSGSHISFMADKVEDLLETAKNLSDTRPEITEPGSIYDGVAGRNTICCQGEVFSWEDFSDEWERSKIFTRLLDDPKTRSVLTGGRIQHLKEYSRMYKRFLISHDIYGLMYSPYLEYDISRNIDYKSLPNEMRNYLESLRNNAADYRKPKKELYFAEFSMSMVQKLRKEKQNGQ